jgi:hypothetical protein
MNLLEGIDLYDVAVDEWQQGGTLNDPGKLRNPAWGSGIYTFWLFGGLRDGSQMTNTGYYYSVSNAQWVPVQSWDLGAAREGAFGAFRDTSFWVWGGQAAAALLDDGGIYSINAGWRSLTGRDAPSARYSVLGESGWAFGTNNGYVMIGGLEAPQHYLRDGGIFRADAASDEWQAIPAWPGSASHAFGAVVWVGGELVIWGGHNGNELSEQGLRYLPP